MDNRRKRKKRIPATAFILVRTQSDRTLRRQLQRSLQAIHDRAEDRKAWRPHTHSTRPPGREIGRDAWRGEKLQPLSWR